MSLTPEKKKIHEEIPELFSLAKKTQVSVFGSLVEKPLREVGDIDLIIESPDTFLKDLKEIAKKYSKTLDVFVEPVYEEQRVQKLLIFPDGRVVNMEDFAGKSFFYNEVNISKQLSKQEEPS